MLNAHALISPFADGPTVTVLEVIIVPLSKYHDPSDRSQQCGDKRDLQCISDRNVSSFRRRNIFVRQSIVGVQDRGDVVDEEGHYSRIVDGKVVRR